MSFASGESEDAETGDVVKTGGGRWKSIFRRLEKEKEVAGLGPNMFIIICSSYVHHIWYDQMYSYSLFIFHLFFLMAVKQPPIRRPLWQLRPLRPGHVRPTKTTGQLGDFKPKKMRLKQVETSFLEMVFRHVPKKTWTYCHTWTFLSCVLWLHWPFCQWMRLLSISVNQVGGSRRGTRCLGRIDKSGAQEWHWRHQALGAPLPEGAGIESGGSPGKNWLVLRFDLRQFIDGLYCLYIHFRYY